MKYHPNCFLFDGFQPTLLSRKKTPHAWGGID